jgi:outer membrane protein OmpA-like peptidoglycan-associated protein
VDRVALEFLQRQPRVVERGAEVAAGAAEDMAVVVVAEFARVVRTAARQREGEGAHRAAGGAAVEPARVVDRIGHLAQPEPSERLEPGGGRHAEHHAPAAATREQSEHQARVVRRAPMGAAPELEGPVPAVHEGGAVLDGVELLAPDQRAIAEQPQIVAPAPVGDHAFEQRLGVARQRRRSGGGRGWRIWEGSVARPHDGAAYNFTIMAHPPIIYVPNSLSYGDHRMSSPQDEDSQQRFALGFLFALIALLVCTIVGFAVYRYGLITRPEAPAATAPAATVVVPTTPTVSVVTETVTVVVPEGASISVADGVVNFYFATGSADLAPGAAEALAAVIQGIGKGRRAMVSGFHDSTGDATVNEELAKLRAQTVRDVLLGLGVPADRVDLQKPAVSTGSGNNAEARRVEVKLID